MTGYASFCELRKNEIHGVDYRIRMRCGDSGIAVMAIHGGNIEPGTTEIAEAVAGSRHTFYTFSGLKKSGNSRLHLTSSEFDYPSGLQIARRSRTVITLHGCRDPRQIVFLGGRDETLKRRVAAALTAAGFEVGTSSRFPGLNPDNICNRSRRGRGVQIEISNGLRKRFFPDISRRELNITTALFDRFVAALQGGLQD